MKLWSMPSSGNSYKVRLLLALLGRDCEILDVEYQTEALERAKAEGRLPFGKAPVLELDDGRLLPESNAILCWLGEGTRFVPKDAFGHAAMLGWMFWEQNQHEGVVAVRAALRTYPHRRAQATPERMAELLERGHVLLQVMEDRLAGHDWLVGDAPSLADICLYGYTHTAGSLGGFDMARFPGIGRWLDRIAALPGYEGLEA
ncbi:glutathione S-transferase family protein [Paracoccus sp. P2]|uniref:Glutathione S-transferase n=1 Tax=Paracoccus pantotrophus TaxID=82367 RepID=A0A1I5JQ82_PARPN|nr:glutathione S-transferase family protein [Paracoccus pantotrophus]MDF3855550.1 glutathione S-transferase family protein [Paracoccus pantotrophus]QFG37359.1 glutathione S-transferase family protein [Paracoccus pantotrophus]QLH15171.1 glutathione S-transferase family protein [Paracoccus pantotrophus]RDD96912.1 glutathione S-transferase family protein [Paracoccus pantotrophus]RKS52201.1 glutathione S-transferase [Paracoccus pantotrophus]